MSALTRRYWEIPSWSGPANEETAERVTALIDEILRHSFTYVDIVKDMGNARVSTGQSAEVGRDGTVARITRNEHGNYIQFSAAGYFFGLELDGSRWVSWHEQNLKISGMAPAGHPTLFIFVPESEGGAR